MKTAIGRTIMLLKNSARLGLLVLGLAFVTGVSAWSLKASDHDDGEVDTKGRNRNLTDLFVFREVDQRPGASSSDLIFVMNTNPRSLPRQQYYFSNNAQYEFKVSRVANNEAGVTGRPDVTLRFEFGLPDANNRQSIKVTAIRDGQTFTAQAGTTTALSDNQNNPRVNQVSLGGSTLRVFAGLREDPFFFDVTQYFRVRAGARDLGPDVGFRPPNTAVDFARDYNVNTIVVRVPRQFLQSLNRETTFDVWETISVPVGGETTATGNFRQFERLARPAINEGLIVPNDLLNALNMVGPEVEAAALAGQQPAATIAAPIVADARKTLIAFGNSEARANALIAAFLPDVMRIDTTQASGYGNALNTKGSPIRGRKLTDDVIDITLQVVTNNPAATDNVSYNGTPGNPGQGHDPLVPNFPYLALPN